MHTRFNALGLAEDRLQVELAIRPVIDRGWFVLGPELDVFESEFAAACGAAHAVAVNSGTDALMLALRGLNIGPGDEVITAPLTAAYTALAIRVAGAWAQALAVPRQPAFADLPAGLCPEADCLTASVLSVPLHPTLPEADVDEVAAAVARFSPAAATRR